MGQVTVLWEDFDALSRSGSGENTAQIAARLEDGGTTLTLGNNAWVEGEYEHEDTNSARYYYLLEVLGEATVTLTPDLEVTLDIGGTTYTAYEVGPITQWPAPSFDISGADFSTPKTITIRVTNSDPTGGDKIIIDWLTMRLTYNTQPPAPTLNSPANAANVTTLTPTFSATRALDGDSGSDLSVNAYQLEVRRNSNNALMWSTGWTTTGLSGTSFSAGYAGSALSDNVTYKWRARFRDASGQPNNEGQWSAYRTFTTRINDAPTASQVSPAASASVGTLTPDLVIGFSDPDSGDVFTAYQIQVRKVSDQTSFWDPGQVATTSGEQTAGQATVTYAGTTLVHATAYEWRVRVQDAGGLWSDYTSWRSFTPNLTPNPPTLTSPSGLTDTLTPTIAGTYNQGDGGTETDFQYEIRQGLTTIYSSGDVTADISTGQAYGTDNSGDTPSSPPALAWGTDYQIRLRSKDNAAAYSDWTDWADFNTNAAPTTPSGITPANGAIVADTTPTVTWVHNDPDDDAQTQADIELYDVTDEAFVTGYNPKTLTQATLTHDITETLTDTHQYQLRVRTKGLAGPGFGPWSSAILFTVANVPVFTLTEPDPDDVTATSALTVTWTFSGGSGTQASYRVRIYEDDQATLVYDSGVQAGTDLTWAVPAGSIQNGETYYAEVSGADSLDQDGSTGKVRFSASFSLPASVTGLVATVVGDQS